MESPKSHASEVVRSTPPAHSVSSSTVHRQPRPDRQEESERLRGVVKSLKGERNALHTRLQEREYVVPHGWRPATSGRGPAPVTCVVAGLELFWGFGEGSAHGSRHTDTFLRF